MSYGTRKDGRVYRKRAVSLDDPEFKAMHDRIVAENEKAYAERGNTYIGDSPVHGKGLFASRDIAQGEELVTPAHTVGFNSRRNPNARGVGHGTVVAIRPIRKGEEIFMNYPFEGDYRE